LVTVSDTKILQSILHGQVSIRNGIKRVEKKVGKVEKNLTERMDKLGSQLAYLEDDVPTKEEIEVLDKRVGKLETQIVLA